jgi:hypothetical protein
MALKPNALYEDSSKFKKEIVCHQTCKTLVQRSNNVGLHPKTEQVEKEFGLI